MYNPAHTCTRTHTYASTQLVAPSGNDGKGHRRKRGPPWEFFQVEKPRTRGLRSRLLRSAAVLISTTLSRFSVFRRGVALAA